MPSSSSCIAPSFIRTLPSLDTENVISPFPSGAVNFVCRSNCHANAGLIVKDASVSSGGNGGGSKTFAQGGGKTDTAIEEIIKHVKKVLLDEE